LEHLFFKNEQIIIQKAVHPEEVYWDNLRFTKKELMKKYIIGIFIDLGVQAFCMGFQLFI
jgi:hypothetical protein